MQKKTQHTDALKRVEQELKKCVKCGACRAHCPAFTAFQREPAVARGKVALAQHLLKGDIALDDQTYLAMSKCLLCGSCVEKCPNDVPTDEIVMVAREALAQQRGLTTFHQAVGRVIANRKLMNFGALAARDPGAALLPQGACHLRAAAAVSAAIHRVNSATCPRSPESRSWTAIRRSSRANRESRGSSTSSAA